MEHYKEQATGKWSYSYCRRCDTFVWNTFSRFEHSFWSWLHRRVHG